MITNELLGAERLLRSTNCAATQEFPSILWNFKVYCRVHKSPQIPVLR
jgi:hypothetical protein